MSDLPEMLQGAIAREYLEILQSAWLFDEREPGEQTKFGAGCSVDRLCEEPRKTEVVYCTAKGFCRDEQTKRGAGCEDDPPSKLKERCGGRYGAFQPGFAGWWTPPDLHAR